MRMDDRACNPWWCLPKSELSTKTSTKRQLCCRLAESLVLNSIYLKISFPSNGVNRVHRFLVTLDDTSRECAKPLFECPAFGFFLYTQNFHTCPKMWTIFLWTIFLWTIFVSTIFLATIFETFKICTFFEHI